MSRKGLRIPMFVKFLVGCLALAALLIVGGTLVVKSQTRLKSRGNYLQKQVRRFNGFIETIGSAMTGSLEHIVAESDVRAALAGKTVDGTKPNDPAAQAAEEFEGLSTKHGIQPDLFVVFTATNKLIWAPASSPINPGDLPQLASVEKARIGSAFNHRIEIIGGIPYQVTALPVRAPVTNEVVGGIMLGVQLQRYMDKFAEQSDDDPELRMRPSLVDGLTVLASAWAPDRRSDLAHALVPEKLVRIAVGDDVRDVVRMREGDFDFYQEDLDGYKGGDSSSVGKLTVTRSRATLADPADHLPWMEIAIGIVASIGIAFFMAFWITRPIKQFVKQSQMLLTGDTDLTQRIVVSSHDETADLAENINQVFSRLHHLATNVQSAAFQVGASSAEISAASKQMLGGLKDQTLKIESSTTAVTELSASIQTVAGNAAEATKVAEASSTAVTSAVQRMEGIRVSVDDAAEKMRELGESSKRIGNIVEVIRQISEQTSMLALNASIEAAHAGEQGRGFAVVADEVSSLARRVGQSAKDIEALIQTVKEQTQAAMASMDIGTREVGSGSALVTDTLTGLGQLITVVRETASAVQEQAVVSDEIARNMDAVRGIAGEVLSGSEESVVQAERLHELAFDLEESIGGFNLDGSRIGAPATPKLSARSKAKAALATKSGAD